MHRRGVFSPHFTWRDNPVIRYECDRCGVGMGANDAQRFLVRLEVFAAAGHVDLDAESSTASDKGIAEVLSDLAKADPDEIEDQTYRMLRFDVCDACRRELLKRPLG